jgi:hypothetical protein
VQGYEVVDIIEVICTCRKGQKSAFNIN